MFLAGARERVNCGRAPIGTSAKPFIEDGASGRPALLDEAFPEPRPKTRPLRHGIENAGSRASDQRGGTHRRQKKSLAGDEWPPAGSGRVHRGFNCCHRDRSKHRSNSDPWSTKFNALGWPQHRIMSNRIGRAEFAWQKRSRDGPGLPCYAVRLKSGRAGFYPLPETGGGLPAVYREIATPELTLPCSPATEDTHTRARLALESDPGNLGQGGTFDLGP